MGLASPGFTRWTLHRSNRNGVLLLSRLAQQAAPRVRGLHDWPGGPARGDGFVETFQSVCETSMLAWASGASKRAAWLWRRCWLGGALSLGERLLRHSSLALELT